MGRIDTSGQLETQERATSGGVEHAATGAPLEGARQAPIVTNGDRATQRELGIGLTGHGGVSERDPSKV